MDINQMAKDAHKNSFDHGFWDDFPTTGLHRETSVYLGSKIALIHSEASEALEELRTDGGFHVGMIDDNGKPIGLDSELADIIIRVGDLAAFLHIDLNRVIQAKMTYNSGRPIRHGKAF